MHIPKGPTAGLELALFEPALQAALQPSLDYDAARWLYVPNTYSEYRYILGTRGKKPLICVGINPSTAAPDALDPTLQSAQRIALANGYDSFLMFNVYAQRATRPDDMEHALNPALHAENRKAFRYLLSLSDQPAVWAAWGNIILKRDYLMDCMRDFAADGKAAGAKWYTAGPLLKSGQPHHPLYLKKAAAVFHGIAQVVGHHDGRQALFPHHPVGQRHDGIGGFWVQGGGVLIQDEKINGGHGGHQQGDRLPLPPGKRPHFDVHFVLQPQPQRRQLLPVGLPAGVVDAPDRKSVV